MKKFLMAAVALTAMTATPALAASGTSQTYNFDGSVASLCSISGAASTVGFGALTDSNGNYTSGASKDATDTGAYCNQAATTATISHTNLSTTNAATAGFVNVIPMSASLTTDQTSLSDSTSATGTGSSAGTTGPIGAFNSLKVTATLGSVTGKLVSGTYNGSITVTLTPAS